MLPGKSAYPSGSIDASASALREMQDAVGALWNRGKASDGGRDEPQSQAPPRIGRFEVSDILGQGGFGVVLRAYDPLLDRPRALKVPQPEIITDPSAISRFAREARAAAALDHPNIIRLYEADDSGAVFYLVMEYCEAGSLADWLSARPERGRLPAHWVAELVAKIADGVEHAHARGIFHRDLKPSNILLGPDDSQSPPADPPRFCPKVADFGLAKILDFPGTERTASDALVGTLAYMAPEQARGRPREFAAPSDVYGLGAILYELLTGRRPFAGLERVALIDHILNKNPATPRAIRPDIPADLETICLKCLAKSPRDRYQTAAALADDLRSFTRAERIRGRRLPLRRKIADWARGRPRAAALAGFAALSTLTVLAASTADHLRGAENARREDARQAVAWLQRLEAADIPALPGVLPGRLPDDPLVSDSLRALFQGRDPARRLASAVALAPIDSACADHAFEALLAARPEELEPLTRALATRLESLAARLEATIRTVADAAESPAIREEVDRRRANAGAALIHLGGAEPAWRLFQFDPNPQSRSFLIHTLGPSGIPPAAILERLRVEPDAGARRALIQALGETPGPDGDARVIGEILDVYRDDPDAGVHGSAKWLLHRWGERDAMKRIDDDLQANPRPEGEFGWRIGPLGLTFVKVADPALDLVIEVTDTEIPVEVYMRFRPTHPYVREVSPTADSPMNSLNYCDGADFCNRLTFLDFGESGPYSYRRGVEAPFEPIPDNELRPGYRLLTDREYERACRAGTTTTRHYGDAPGLLGKYAKFDEHTVEVTVPVTALKPNDYGLFGTLGNVFEICQSTSDRKDARNQAAVCGGCFAIPEFDTKSDFRIGPIDVMQPNVRGIADRFGLRVARTLERRDR